jgi:hypothetical protein
MWTHAHNHEHLKAHLRHKLLLLLFLLLLFLLLLFNFLEAFRKLRKVTTSFVMPVRPSHRTEQPGSHWKDFHQILYLSIFRKSVEKIQV